MTRRQHGKNVYDEVRTIYQDLPCSVRGFCYHDLDGNAYIVLNSRMSKAQQKQTWRHEYRHIIRGEMYDPSYREYD